MGSIDRHLISTDIWECPLRGKWSAEKAVDEAESRLKHREMVGVVQVQELCKEAMASTQSGETFRLNCNQ